MKKINSICIIGLGLIGGSFAKAFKKAGYKVYGLDNNIEAQDKAKKSKIFNEVYSQLHEIYNKGFDLIYLTTPVVTSNTILSELVRNKYEGLITDAGSTKLSIYTTAITGNYYVNFVGGHPIAGKEKKGFENSDPKILNGATHIIVKGYFDKEENIRLVSNLHESIGMIVKTMPPHTHDEIFASVSHLPHCLSFAMIHSLHQQIGDNLYEYAGAGLEDTTRIAASNPIMWTEVFVDNKKNMVKQIDDYISLLNKYKKMIDNGDYNRLKHYLSSASEIRQKLSSYKNK